MASEINKTIANSFLAIATLATTALLWQNTALLSAILLVIGIMMIRIEKSRNTAIIYFAAFIFGTFAEMFVIYFGAWSYTSPDFIGIPFWLPFIWGIAGLFINRLNILIQYTLKKRG